MFSQYYGSYLLKRKLISAEQLRHVLERESSTKVRIGILAIDAGYMTAQQVNQVNEMQKRENLRFGEIAIKQNYMTHEQLDELLSNQKQSHLSISQTLLDMDIMGFEQVETVFNEFKKDSGFSDKELEALKNNDIDNLVPLFLKDVEGDFAENCKTYATLFIKTLIRFITSDIRLEKAERLTQLAFSCFSFQEITGHGTLYTGITAEQNSMLQLANVFGREDRTSLDDIAIDALKELINTHNGLYVSEMSGHGVELDLAPPVLIENGTVSTKGHFIRIHFTIPHGEFSLLLIEGPMIV